MDRRDNARIEELNNLRLALATFALQLDAFEMRIGEATLGLGSTDHFNPASRPTPANVDRPRDTAGRLQKENRIGRR